MSLVVGCICNYCGDSDIESFVNGREIDYFPRNGWISITTWSGELEGSPETDIHVCSLNCLKELSVKLLESAHEQEHEHGHPHDHTH